MTIDPTTFPENESDGSMGRRAMLGKIAAGGALVWASPLITSTASAQTAGTCLQSGILRWNEGVWNTWPSGNGQTRTGQIQTTGVVATVSTSFHNMAPANTGSVTDHARSVQSGVSYIEFGQTSANRTTYAQGHRTVRVDFGTEVTNVQFNIRDIDWSLGALFGWPFVFSNWDDRIAVTSNGSVARTVTSDLQGPGTGTATNSQAVWRTNEANLSFPGDPGGRVNYTISGSPTWLEIHYWNGNRNNSDNILQQVYLSQISFGCA